MEKQQNIAQIQQKIVIQIDNNVAKIMLAADRRKMASAYLQMFAGFAWVNWTNQYSLGRAWQTALTQCGAFVNTKHQKNPAAKYLANVYGAHKKYWSRIIMISGARENTINPDDKKIQELRKHGENMIRTAMDQMNLILAQYNERVEEMVAAQSQQSTTHANATGNQTTQKTTQAHQAQPAQQLSQHATRAPQMTTNNAAEPAKVQQPAQQKPILRPVAIATATEKPAAAQTATLPKVRPSTVQPPAKQVATSAKAPQTTQKPDNRAAFNIAKLRIEQQTAQMKLAMQQKMKIWIIGQKYQNAA